MGGVDLLEIRDITKLYSDELGVKKISFLAAEGKIISLIGPNGAGKSTLLNIIAGALYPNKGEVLLNSEDVRKPEAKKYIGYMPDNISVNPKIKTKELLYIISDYKYEGRYKTEIAQAMEDYKIQKYANIEFRKLSMGTKKKLGMIIAFMGMPPLIILDEPTNGVDTEGILKLKENIMVAKKKGSIIIVSSHILDFIDAIADQNIFLKDGIIQKIAGKEEDLEKIYQKLYL